MNAWISKFFLSWLSFLPQSKPYAHFILHFLLFIAGFQNFYFFFLELKMRSLSQCFFVCIKWIETVMIRSANSQIAKLLFLLSISFQLLTNGIDQKSLLIFWFLSSQWLKIRENGLIQHCERSELRFHFEWTKVHWKCQKSFWRLFGNM